jgi:hypothetical protein
MNPDTATSGAVEPTAAVTADPQGDAKAYAESKAKPSAPATPEAAPAATPDDDAKAQAETAEREKRSRTTQYIERLKAENAENRRRLAELEASQSQRATPQPRQTSGPQHERQGPPTLEECDFDPIAWQQANNEWLKADLRREESERQAREREQQTLGTYHQKLAAFVETHPDFEEAVGSIDPRFYSPELERAILSHDLGPAIAYHLATNDEALWQIASVRPDLVPEAINRLASRLGSAPAVTQQAPPAAPVPPVQNRPISQAPPPVPVLAGRAPSAPSPEKMTDDEWYKADREKRRKR